jgi:hypothetical protein
MVHVPMAFRTLLPKMTDTYALLEHAHTEYLKTHGVRLPGRGSGLGLALCCLAEHPKTPLSIETIRDYVTSRGVVLSGGDSLQVRHLAKQNGWNMLKNGETAPDGQKVPKSHFMLLDLETPHPDFKAHVRSSTLTDTEWTTLKESYGNACVNCGSVEGQPMRWDRYSTTVLQKGHMDPRKAVALGNVIPQCRCCNQQYKDKAVFNERGYVTDWLR